MQTDFSPSRAFFSVRRYVIGVIFFYNFFPLSHLVFTKENPIVIFFLYFFPSLVFASVQKVCFLTILSKISNKKNKAFFSPNYNRI